MKEIGNTRKNRGLLLLLAVCLLLSACGKGASPCGSSRNQRRYGAGGHDL